METNLVQELQILLKNTPLYIADVGATGGPEIRWKKWESLCYFYTFDPDPRAKPWSCSSTNYPIGLWSKKCTKTLTLAAYPPATSLYKMNQDEVKAFLHHASLNPIGTEKIPLDTLDATLHDQPLDFLKVDAEGAELEILKGAKQKLEHACLGIQVEVCFCPIREKAPLFSDIDRFVRGYDFQLFQLHREHWIRKNNLSSFQSEPQLIWGNAFYLLSKKAFLTRLNGHEEPTQLFLKYITLLCAYNLFDYAYELCEEVALPEAVILQNALRSLPKATVKHLAGLLFSLLAGTGKYALCVSKKRRQHRLCYLKRKVRALGQACLYLGKNSYAVYD